MMDLLDLLNLRMAYTFPGVLGDMGYETFRKRHAAIYAGERDARYRDGIRSVRSDVVDSVCIGLGDRELDDAGADLDDLCVRRPDLNETLTSAQPAAAFHPGIEE